MKHLLAFAILTLSATAQAAEPARAFANWRYLRDPANPAIAFDAGAHFLKTHRNWPEENLIRLRTEEAALREQVRGGDILSFCANHPPISGRGMIACVQAGYGSRAEQDAAVRQAWYQGDFGAFEESMILKRYGALLDHAAHWKRADRLLFEGKTAAAARMMPLLSADEKKLVEARISLSSGGRDANAKLARVPGRLRSDPGLILDRIRWRNARGLNMEMRELFLTGPKDPPYADAWWPLRAVAVREALQAAQYRQALEIIARHGALKSEFMAEALWLKGWITLTYRHNAEQAYQDFYALYHAVSTPVSLARGAYWAAEAARLNGNDAIARDWLAKAAEHPTVFYGQLAHQTLYPGKPLSLPARPDISDSARAAFARQELVRVARMLADQGEMEMVDRFLRHLATQAKTPEQFALLAELAQKTHADHGGVVVAKAALRKGIILPQVGWPTMAIPRNLAVEPALMHAIVRQESEFNAQAQSRANARGLMQLLPATARDTARKTGLPFGPEDIWNPITNVTLGSAYLGRLVAAYDGSYILAIAAYNAGPRNASNWAADFGRPSGDVHGAVNWVENIPFGETRNYVQRVLENLQIYRQLLKPGTPVQLKEDLIH